MKKDFRLKQVVNINGVLLTTEAFAVINEIQTGGVLNPDIITNEGYKQCAEWLRIISDYFLKIMADAALDEDTSHEAKMLVYLYWIKSDLVRLTAPEGPIKPK